MDGAGGSRQWGGVANEPLSLLEPGVLPTAKRAAAVVLQSGAEPDEMVGHAGDFDRWRPILGPTSAVAGRYRRPNQEQTSAACKRRDSLPLEHRKRWLARSFRALERLRQHLANDWAGQ